MRSAFVLSMILASLAHAAEVPVLVIDTELRGARGTLLSLDEQGATYIDENGASKRRSAETIAAILPTRRAGEPDASNAGVLELVDGQRYPGALSATAADGELVAWEHPVFGRMDIPIERVARVVRDDNDVPSPERAPDSDEIFLTNGDRLRGFLIELGQRVVFESETGIVDLDATRVAGAVLSNPRERGARLLVWLNDGSIVEADRVVAQTGEQELLSVDPVLGSEGAYEITQFVGLAYDASSLVPLSVIPSSGQEPIGPRVYAPLVAPYRSANIDAYASVGPALFAEDLMIDGPMRVSWELPRGSARFATVVSLLDQTSAWADCEFVVRVGERELARERLNASSPTVAIGVDLPADIDARELVITLEAGARGAVDDRVVLVRPLVLVAD